DQRDAFAPTTPQPGDRAAIGVCEVVSRQARGADVGGRLRGQLFVRPLGAGEAREDGERNEVARPGERVLQTAWLVFSAAAWGSKWSARRRPRLPIEEDWG